MTTLKGCDISGWQSETPQGYDFYIIKASEGTQGNWKLCSKHRNNAKGWGKKIGFYHFARPDLGTSANKEADAFLNTVGNDLGKAVLALDLECKNYQNYTEWTKQWLEYVINKTGVRPWLYTMGEYFYKFKGIANNLNVGVWACSSDSYYAGSTIVCKQSVYDNLDHDTFYGGIDAWDKFCNPNSDIKLKKTNEELATEVINGLWGNGSERKSRLESAGYNYDSIQSIVNARLGANTSTAKYHTVQKDDTLSGIAKQHNTTLSNLLKLNPNIKNANLIYPNQKVRYQ